MESRKEYPVFLVLNGLILLKAVIDQHYKIKHREMSDELILKLIHKLDGERITPIDERGEFQYFKVEPIFLEKRPYRLIFLLAKNENYIGIINAFRVQEK